MRKVVNASFTCFNKMLNTGNASFMLKNILLKVGNGSFKPFHKMWKHRFKQPNRRIDMHQPSPRPTPCSIEKEKERYNI